MTESGPKMSMRLKLRKLLHKLANTLAARRLFGYLSWIDYRWQSFRGRRVVHFLHIDKTGGTAIKSVLQGHTLTRDYCIRLHRHEYALWQTPRGSAVVCFLRDPASRFVSGFLCRQRESLPRYHIPWTADERTAFEVFDSPSALAEALSSTDPERRLAAERAMRKIYHVNSAYRDWFGSVEMLRNRAKDILFIGFQESLAHDFNSLKRLLGLPNELRLPEDIHGGNRNPDRIRGELSLLARENLAGWYAEDYVILEECKQMGWSPTTEDFPSIS